MSADADLISQIHAATTPTDAPALRAQVRRHLDHAFADLDVLLGHAGPSSGPLLPSQQKRKRTLKEEIGYWEREAAAAARELEETSALLPDLLAKTQERLQGFLSSAQSLSIERYALADKLAHLVSELSSSPVDDERTHDDLGGHTKQGKAVLEHMETLQHELARLEAGLAWATVLEQVMLLSERTLSKDSHRPSPLAALPYYQDLHTLVASMESTLPSEMTLLKIIIEVRDTTWAGMKDLMSQNLLKACEPLKWPLRVHYHAVPASERRTFERAFKDLLYLQAEGESLHAHIVRPSQWYAGEGLYPLQAMVQPIALRFKYHFQGSRGTNRIDKPEWAIANILDQIYEHQSFVEEYLQPLANRAGFASVDVKSEFTMLLFPILLGLLRARIPRLLDHPSLLAHTIYQTVVFDDTVRASGFDIDAVSIYEGIENAPWDGLAGVLLREQGWFEQWLAGEKKFADAQLNDIISASDAWTISDEITEREDGPTEIGLKPTVSSRQVKALVEQILDRYSPLPSLEHRLPFLTTIQLPLLNAYHSRISGSLDAFETLSSTFVRVVPGALSGNTRSGAHIDQTKLTSGVAGLERLMKAHISASWILAALRAWADDVFFVEMSMDLRSVPEFQWRIQADSLLPVSLKSGDASDASVTVFDVLVDKYATLCGRTDDMIVRHVTVEVENDLKQHLTRRWDQTTTDDRGTDASLLTAITTFSTHLTDLNHTLPLLTTSRLYRRIVLHISNHIQQRAVYAGWSRFTAIGGRDFADEAADWRQASSSSLPENIIVNSPWTRLSDIGRILSLPSDATFSLAMAAAWSDSEESLQNLNERIGLVDVGRNELQGILRRRIECWR